jgi:hypothetical protein
MFGAASADRCYASVSVGGLFHEKEEEMRIALLGAGVMVVASAAWAQPSLLASRTIFLERGPGAGATPAAVAYHPAFEQYYASNAGSPSFAAWVYDRNGNRIQNLGALGIDARGWMYNPRDGKLLVNTFDSAFNGVREARVDVINGMLLGTSGTVLAPVPGAAGPQSMFAYNPKAHVFYSYETSNVVNVIDAATGALAGIIMLNWAAAGVTAADVTDYAIGFDPDRDWLIQVNATHDRALVFSLSGAFLGASQLNVDVQPTYRMGYANGQLFVFDPARNGWQGFNIACEADLDGNGVIDFNDFLAFMNLYNAGCN